jgi:ribokinase
MIDVLVAGELYVDLVMSGFDALPEPGREVFARNFAREIGGGTAITASGLARLGVRCGVFGLVGADAGDWVKKRLTEQHVDATYVHFHPTEPTAVTVVATTTSDRAFLSYEGANRGLEEAFLTAVRQESWIRPKHVHLAYAPSCETAAVLCKVLREKGATISLDVGWRLEWLSHQDAVAVLREIDIFFPNLPEAQRITGEQDAMRILEVFRNEGVGAVALKMGSEGSALLMDEAISFAKPPVVNVVDTTGAGDSFDAGFLAAWLAGRDRATCLLQANICGALSTRELGGISAFPDLVSVERELTGMPSA